MRHSIGQIVIAMFATIVFSAGLHAQQDTTHARDTTRHVRHHTRDTTMSNGRVGNQDQSGVVNKKGKSTLGPKVKKTTPTQGQPVTAKGDTLRPGKQQTDSGPPHQ